MIMQAAMAAALFLFLLQSLAGMGIEKNLVRTVIGFILVYTVAALVQLATLRFKLIMRRIQEEQMEEAVEEGEPDPQVTEVKNALSNLMDQ